MVNLLSKIAIISVVLLAILYQFLVKFLIFDVLGYGRSFSTLSSFPVQCKKIDQLGLEACEDMWLHEPTGYLYMACGDSESKTQWLPSVDFFNASGRGLLDRIAILNTRGPGQIEDRIKWLSATKFQGISGDGTFNLHGFDIRADPNTETLRILLINHRPPFDPVTGVALDPKVVGANSTVELFQTKAGSDSMRHVRTYADELIQTPNRVAWVSDHAFVFTNDHSGKVGFRRSLDGVLGGGNVGYCSRNKCNIATTKHTFHGPNGLVRGRDSLIYVPNTVSSGIIDVFSLDEHHILKLVDTIEVPYPVDNLSVDNNGDIFAASFPQVYKWVESSKDPFNVNVPSAIVRIRKAGMQGKKGKGRKGVLLQGELGDWDVETILEDDGSVVGGASIAVHDVETGRIFTGGAVAPFISICETR